LTAQREYEVDAPPGAEMRLGTVEWPTNLSPVHFIKLELRDKEGKLSDNFYWRALSDHQDNFQALEKLPTVTLDAEVAREDRGDKCLLDVKLRNPSPHIALMTHLQLRHKDSHDRVLPAYYSDNYVSFAPGETKTITVEAALSAMKVEDPVVMVDGWNVAVKSTPSGRATVALNEDAQVKHSSTNGLPVHVQ
jgi:beta-mannosidase